MPAELDTTDYR